MSILIETLAVIAVFILGLFGFGILKRKYKMKYNGRVLTALVAGIIFGGIIQMIFGATSEVTTQATLFMSLFSEVYIKLLKLIVVPLILVSITMAIIDAAGGENLGKKISQIIGMLMVTVMISASIGIVVVNVAHINGNAIVAQAGNSEEVTSKTASVEANKEIMENGSYVDIILAPVPQDLSFLTSGSGTAALSTVLFGLFLGYSTLQINKRKPEKAKSFIEWMRSLKEIVLSMVREILKFTPFAIFAMMSIFASTSTLASLGELVKFLIATYVAILIMYGVHIAIVAAQGVSAIKYIKKTWPVLLFGFGSRSSMAAMPLNIEAQVNDLGVDPTSANLSATFGTTIGQNGCAGIYPAMLAVMAAGVAGVTMSLSWYLMLIIVIAISSFGIAGVGGGATFAAIAVLSIMGLPVEMAAILVGIEPLLDMARTALNISDSMVTGVTVANLSNTLDKEIANK